MKFPSVNHQLLNKFFQAVYVNVKVNMALCQPQHPDDPPFFAQNAALRCEARDNSQIARYLRGNFQGPLPEAVLRLFEGEHTVTIVPNADLDPGQRQHDGISPSILINPPVYANVPAQWNGQRYFIWNVTLFRQNLLRLRAVLEWPQLAADCWIDHYSDPHPHHSHGICFVSYGVHPTQMCRNERAINRWLTSRAVLASNVIEHIG